MGITLRLLDGTVIAGEHFPAVIGRAIDAHLRLPEICNSVSRQHAQVYESDGRYWIRDLGSANGTKIDGIRIAGPTPLTPTCRVSLGDTEALLTIVMAPVMASSGELGRTAVVPNRVVQPLQQQLAPQPPAYKPPVLQPAPRQQPYPPVPAQPVSADPSTMDDPRHVNLHRGLAWASVGLMFLSFSLPWVRALVFQLNYFQLMRELAKASDAAGKFGAQLHTTAVFLPLIAFLLAAGAGALNHVLPLKQGTLFSAVGGGAGLLTAFGLYSYASSGLGLDVSGALANGYYVFCLAALGLLVESLVLRSTFAPRNL